MNIRWDVRALDDLRDIRRYIARHGSPAAADRVREHLRTRIARLIARPLIGVVTSNPEIAYCRPLGILIVYIIRSREMTS